MVIAPTQGSTQETSWTCVLMNKLDDALSPTSIDKGFKVKDIMILAVMDILLKWIELKEFIELEREDITRDL